MGAFVRTKIKEVDFGQTTVVIALNIKETNYVNGNTEYVQKKPTRYTTVDSTFDSHLYDGRVFEFVFLDKSRWPLAKCIVPVRTLADKAMAEQGRVAVVWLDLEPKGRLQLQVRYLEEDAGSEDAESLRTGTMVSSASSDPTDDLEDSSSSGSEKSITGPLAPRRGAIKQAKIHEVNGHRFVATFFTQPVFCSFCNKFMWGLNKQGYKCKSCGCSVHKACHEGVLHTCPGSDGVDSASPIDAGRQQSRRISINIPHRFRTYNYLKPTFCNHCGSMLVGLYSQGLKCEECGFNCHKQCKDMVGNLCGLNKALKQEISAVRRRSDQTGLSTGSPQAPRRRSDVTGNAPQNPSTVSRLPLLRESMEVKDQDESIYISLVSHGDNTPPKYSLQDFELLKVLGHGSFGKVLLAELKGKKQYYALKALKKASVLEGDDIEYTITERVVLALAVNHPFLTQLFCTFQSKSHLFFVMEYLAGGDLMFHLQNSKRFSVDRARFYSSEILLALEFLHSKGIIYRDLKLDNVLLDSQGHCKLADFGMAKEGQHGKMMTAATFCGTPDYMAPEIIKGDQYDFAVDWWSFGVLLYEMLIGCAPFHAGVDDDPNDELLFKAICQENVHYPRALYPDAKKMLEKLFEKKPFMRLGAATSPHGPIRSQPFFSTVNWTRLQARQVDPPFKPAVRSGQDVQNFELAFTKEPPRLSPPTQHVDDAEQAIFRGFSFTSNAAFAAKGSTPR